MLYHNAGSGRNCDLGQKFAADWKISSVKDTLCAKRRNAINEIFSHDKHLEPDTVPAATKESTKTVQMFRFVFVLFVVPALVRESSLRLFMELYNFVEASHCADILALNVLLPT